MSLEQFRAYQLAVRFYREVSLLTLPSHLKEQMLRAATSVVLNLVEGSARATPADRLRFYRIALGSQRECAAILELAPTRAISAIEICDQLGAHVYRLTRSPKMLNPIESPTQR